MCRLLDVRVNFLQDVTLVQKLPLTLEGVLTGEISSASFFCRKKVFPTFMFNAFLCVRGHVLIRVIGNHDQYMKCTLCMLWDIEFAKCGYLLDVKSTDEGPQRDYCSAYRIDGG